MNSRMLQHCLLMVETVSTVFSAPAFPNKLLSRVRNNRRMPLFHISTRNARKRILLLRSNRSRYFRMWLSLLLNNIEKRKKWNRDFHYLSVIFYFFNNLSAFDRRFGHFDWKIASILWYAQIFIFLYFSVWQRRRISNNILRYLT